MRRGLLGLFLGDPVVLIITAVASGVLVYSVVSSTIIAIRIATAPATSEFELNIGFSEGDLLSLFRLKLLRDITGSFSLVGLLTVIVGAYITGFSRDTGYAAIANLIGVDRRSYLKAQILYPAILYIACTGVLAPTITLTLVDYNLLKYWKIIAAGALLAVTMITPILTLTMLITYALSNTYRGLITTATIVIIASSLKVNNAIENLASRESLNETLATLTITATIAIAAFIITYKLLESRMPTR